LIGKYGRERTVPNAKATYHVHCFVRTRCVILICGGRKLHRGSKNRLNRSSRN